MWCIVVFIQLLYEDEGHHDDGLEWQCAWGGRVNSRVVVVVGLRFVFHPPEFSRSYLLLDRRHFVDLHICTNIMANPHGLRWPGLGNRLTWKKGPCSDDKAKAETFCQSITGPRLYIDSSCMYTVMVVSRRPLRQILSILRGASRFLTCTHLWLAAATEARPGVSPRDDLLLLFVGGFFSRRISHKSFLTFFPEGAYYYYYYYKFKIWTMDRGRKEAEGRIRVPKHLWCQRAL